MFNRKSKGISIICFILIMLMVTSGIALAEENINSESESNGSLKTATQVNGDLDYETEADSWRYKDGYLIQNEDSTMFRSRAAYTPWSKVDGGFINSRGEIIEGAIKKGIDVSEFQGNIDWQTVKNSGIDFAIIRCGYGSDYSDQDDAKWLRNVSECERLGIPYGVYLYSYANTTAKARSEAEHVLRLLKGHNPTYPVYYDLEDKVVSSAGRSAIINYANIFCSTIEANGYRAGIYANLNWWDTKLNDSSLNKYEKWVAQWNYRCTYEGDYRLWQCTSDGSVPGISGRVDLNFEFFKEDSIVDIDNYMTILIAEYKNYREGPSTSYNITGKINQGDEVIVTHIVGDWGKLENGSWMNLSGTAKVNDIEDYKVVVYDKYKNYRKGPDIACGLTGKINQGDEATVTHMVGNWGKLENGSWMNLSGAAKVNDIEDYKVVVYDKYKNYRKGPDIACGLTGKINQGDEATVTHMVGNWGKLENGSWMNLSGTAKVNDIEDYKVVVYDKYKNYRKGPDIACGLTGKINQGDEATVTHIVGNWGKLENGSWMNLSGTAKVNDIEDYKVVVYDKYKNYRKGPDIACGLTGKINQGDEATVTHIVGNWGMLENGSWMNLSGTAKIDDVPDYTVVLNDVYKNLRKGPDINCNIIGRIKKGDEVTVTHRVETWGKLKNGSWMNLANTSEI